MPMMRYICAAYWLLLTTLLLVPDPLALLGLSRIPGNPGDTSAHFIAFAMLGVLTLGGRVPLRGALLAGLLIGYATATELLQSLVGRDTSALDLLADFVGLAAGTAIWRLLQRHVLRTPKQQE